MDSRRPLKLWIASTVIFGAWIVVFGAFIQRQAAEAGESVDLKTIAQLRPPAEWQFSVVEQNGTALGYSWTHVQEQDVEGKTRYAITERSKLRAGVAGAATDTAFTYEALLDDRFRLLTFRGAARLASVEFTVDGSVSNRELALSVGSSEGEQTQTVQLNDDLYLPLTALPYLATARFEVGKAYTLKTFNPLTGGSQEVRVRVLGRESQEFLGKSRMTMKLELTLAGITTYLYVDEVGNRVREESADGSIVSRATSQEETFRVDRQLGIPMPSFRR